MTLILLGKFVPLDRSITTNQYLIICVIPQTAPPPPIMRMVYRMISGQSTCHDGWHAFLLTTVVHSDYLNYRSLPVSLSQVIFLWVLSTTKHFPPTEPLLTGCFLLLLLFSYHFLQNCWDSTVNFTLKLNDVVLMATAVRKNKPICLHICRFLSFVKKSLSRCHEALWTLPLSSVTTFVVFWKLQAYSYAKYQIVKVIVAGWFSIKSSKITHLNPFKLRMGCLIIKLSGLFCVNLCSWSHRKSFCLDVSN